MLSEGRICVPETKVKSVIEIHHAQTGHPGIRKSVTELSRRYIFPPLIKLYEEVREHRRKCPVCQACEHPNWSGNSPIDHTPIPPHIMSSVAIDIFSLPTVEWKGQSFDSLLVCVDRHSGWIIARPCTKVGLTAEKAAHLMLDGGWEVFGVPSVITSDQGPQFAGQWWKTMCARLGIRQAYSQAYRPQSNGRAEVAGKSLINALRKLAAQGLRNWVEVLPRALWAYHNLIGESGMSPFQIVFGRDRHEAGVPFPPPKECEDAMQFFDRMSQIDQTVSKVLEEQHLKTQRRLNTQRSEGQPYKRGDLVWVLRPRSSPQTTKLDTWWMGPAKILDRLSKSSYNVQLKPTMAVEVHDSHLKPFVEDECTGKSVELYHHLPTYQPVEVVPGEWNVDTILRHRRGPDGKLQFLTRWEGAEPGEETWEPMDSFILRYCYEVVQYCKEKGLKLDLTQYLKPTTSEAP